MSVFALRLFVYSILPLVLATIHIALDKSCRSRQRNLEIFLLYLFGVGVGAGGIGGFFGHFFISDVVAQSIGWPKGNPFQLEVAFANLALGILGFLAMGQRDGFREATVIAVTVFGVGATIVHIMDIVQTGNLAPGNTLPNVSNLLKPVLLIGFLSAIRRTERSHDSEASAPTFERWRRPRVLAVGLMSACVGTGFGVGFGIGVPAIGAVLGILVGAGLAVITISRASDAELIHPTS
jgi:hypothetical protein